MSAFDLRADRAAALAGANGAAREPLLFAAELCRAQGSVAASLAGLSLTGRLAEDVDRLLPRCDELLRVVNGRLGEERPDLIAYWSASQNDYRSRAVLRPYVELLRIAGIAPDRIHARGHCPFCGGAPLVGSRADSVRRLHCGLCGNEWIFARISCPSCMESTPEKLPVYQTDAHPAARIEACETCGGYVKSIDRTAPPVIPEIDDLSSIALDLWAVEAGYTRLEPGWAGV